MKGRRLLTRRRPCVEELEGRVVPSTLSTSTNWSGYAVATGAGAVTAVAGTWKVPTVTGTSTGYAATWVGIDGWSSPTVEQIGTEADVSNGQAVYYAWYEMYPNYSVTINLAVNPGDTISAQVSYSAGAFALSLTNVTTGHSYSTTQTAPRAARSSAEWIVEAPSNGFGVLPLANFGTETFSGAKAAVSGTTGPIDSPSWASQVQQINMTNRYGTPLDSTSALTDSGSPATSGFTATYTGSTSSPPPPSHHHHGGGGVDWWWWLFTERQPGVAAAQQAVLASSLFADPAQPPIPARSPMATQPAALPAPSVVVSGALSSFSPAGPGITTSGADVNSSDGGGAAVMPLVPADGDESGAPALPPAGTAPDGVPMPPADFGAAPAEPVGRGIAPGWASDALFTDGHWAPAAPSDGAQELSSQPPEVGTTVESVSGVLFALSLGAYWRFSTEESEQRRRRQGLR